MVYRSVSLVAAAAFLLVGCERSATDPISAPPVETVSISAPAESLVVGETMQLAAEPRDAEGNVLEDREVSWASEDTEIATVDPDGVVTGEKAGTVTITATAEGVDGAITLNVTAEFSGQLTYVQVANFGTMMSYGTAPDGDSRFFVSELDGRVWILEDGEVHDEPFLDIRDMVSVGEGERGFLGMTFHPDFPSEPYFFVNYTDHDGHNQIERFRVDSSDPNRIDRGTRHHIITIEQPNPFHNGGELVFGPDDMLYVALGDGSVGVDQAGHGQNPHTLLASMLRIDVINGDPYAIPPDNPFADGVDGAPEVWHYGLRHAWRFDFDAEANLLYLPDVGEQTWEEINVVPADEGGHNFGWAVMEGPDCIDPDDCDTEGLTMPVLWYGPEDGCAVIGGFVYRGEAMPVLQGRYFFADHCQKWVRAIRYENGDIVEDDTWTANLWQIPERINSFGRDGQGELYLLTRDGSVMKIVEG